MRQAAFVVVMAVALTGCPKKSTSGGEGDASATATAATGLILDAKKPAPSASASAAAPGVTASFAGKYSVAAGSMYVPDHKDWSSVKFKNDESKLLGDGEMSLAIDPNGRVSGGTEGGPLGASVVDGRREGELLTATIRRKDPTDDGLTGTLVAKVSGDAIEGTMKLAESNAAVVRSGKLEAKKK